MIGKILTLVVLLIAPPALAAPLKITVSDVPSPALKLPSLVQTMTAYQFRMFAEDFNSQAYQRAEMNAEDQKPIRGEVQIDHTTSDLLFPASPVPAPTAPLTINEQRVTRKYEVTYPGSAGYGGGPVTIINPYCFDYWKQNTE